MADAKPLDELLSEMAGHASKKPFRPCAWYNRDGDTLEIYLSPDDYTTERVDPLWSVFVSPKDRERVIGFAIKKIRHHFGERGLRKIVFSAGRRTIRVLVFAAELAQAFTLERQRAHKPKAPASSVPPTRIASIVEEFGDTRVTVENARSLVAKA